MRQINKSKKFVLAAVGVLSILGLLLAIVNIEGIAYTEESASSAPKDSAFYADSSVEYDENHSVPGGDLTVPASWVGRWKITLRFFNPETGSLVAADEATEAICSTDSFGLSSFATRPPHNDEDDDFGNNEYQGANHNSRRDGFATNCDDSSANDDRLEIRCTSRFTRGNCVVNFLFELGAARSADQFSGQGEWRVVNVSGDCGDLLEGTTQSESFSLAGIRLSSAPNACTAAPSTLVEKFMQHPALIALLPAPVENLSASARNKKVDLTWTPPPGASVYKIFRAAPNQPFELIAARRARRGAEFTDRQLTNGVSYRYFIRWLDREGRQSPNSNEVAAAPAAGQN